MFGQEHAEADDVEAVKILRKSCQHIIDFYKNARASYERPHWFEDFENVVKQFDKVYSHSTGVSDASTL